MDLNWLKQQARRAYWAVETGDVSDLGEFIAPQWRNREAEAEPPAAKGVGPPLSRRPFRGCAVHTPSSNSSRRSPSPKATP
jgi:hypothetical protein